MPFLSPILPSYQLASTFLTKAMTSPWKTTYCLVSPLRQIRKRKEMIKLVSIDCSQSKIEVPLPPPPHIGQSDQTKVLKRANENSRLKQANCTKRGKMWVTKTRLVFESHWLRGWRDFISQSGTEVKQNRSNSGFPFDTRLEITWLGRKNLI